MRRRRELVFQWVSLSVGSVLIPASDGNDEANRMDGIVRMGE